MLIVLINTTLAKAQQNVSINETVYIHTNATTFVTGEKLLYKIYCLKSSDKTPSNISKVSYVELVDNTKQTIFKNKIILENTTGQGDYFIPTTLNTGNYKLIGYTKWMLNKTNSTFFQMDITIINPYKVDNKPSVGNIQNKLQITQSINENNITQNSVSTKGAKLSLNKKIFTNRELVELKMGSYDTIFKEGSYSLSIRKVEDLPSKKQMSAIEFGLKKDEVEFDLENLKSKIQLPELRGEIVSGKITAKNNTDQIENKVVAFSLPGKDFIFKIVRTDALGNFQFNINKANYSSEIAIQLLDDYAGDYDIKLDDDTNLDVSKISIPANYVLSPSIKENLLNRSVNSQIENAYYSKKADSIVKTKSSKPFYYPIAKEYILDEYTRFKTLKETIVEVTTELSTKTEQNRTSLHVYDPTVFPQSPISALVLIDGLYLENQSELYDYKMKNVYKVEIIVGRYFLGSHVFNGLVSFTTFNNDFKSLEDNSLILRKVILRPLPKKKYLKIDYSILNMDKRIPDFRNQLLWNPDIHLNDSNCAFSFYTSDVNGTFEINLEGFAKNGTPISLNKTFEVKDSSGN
jgi:hypothetical protein